MAANLCLNFCFFFMLVARSDAMPPPPPTEDCRPATSSADTLELVQILFRHGDRTPAYDKYTDEHTDYWKAVGYGQLTNTGKEDEYALGDYIRRRYDGFLNTLYDPNEVVTRSTDADRTLMSAEATLAGLYPPVGQEVWNGQVDWQPIPVHTVPVLIDYILNMNSYCPKYDEVLADVVNSSQFQDIMKENAGLLEYISNEIRQNVSCLFDVDQLYDLYFVEKIYNMSLPTWLNDTLLERMEYLSNAWYEYLYHTPEQLRFRGGPLLKEMLINAGLKVNGTIPRRRAFLYSAHDTTLAALMSALGVHNDLLVPYSSALFLELHRPEAVGYPHTIRIFYQNSTDYEQPPYELMVPRCAPTCGTNCPLDRLTEIVAPVLSDDVAVECQILPSSNLHQLAHSRSSTPLS